LNSQVSLILAVLAVPLALSNAQIGLVGMAYTFANSLTQPLFGWWADRFGSRRLAIGGPLWMGSVFAVAMISSGYLPLVLIVLAALGSAAYHPQGTMHATEAGERYAALGAGMGTTTAALFFMAGQGAFAIGPLVGGRILERVGLYGVLAICAVPIIGSVVQWAYFHPLAVIEGASQQSSHGYAGQQIGRTGKLALTAFVLAVFLRSWAQFGVIYYVPRFLAEAGKSTAFYGDVLSVFMLAITVGGVLGGVLADRFGETPVLFLSLVLGALPTGAFPYSGGVALFVVTVAAGLFLGAGHTLIVVIAQRLVPGKRATASGFTLGFMFASGGVGMFISGILADHIGLAAVLEGQGLLVFVAAGAVLAWKILR